MAIRSRQYLKNLWVKGYKPLQVDYHDLFDTVLIQTDPITGYGASAVSGHLNDYDHTLITHSNINALNNVSGINSGDQYIIFTGAISGEGGTAAISGANVSGASLTYINTTIVPGSISTNSISANSGVILGRRAGIGAGSVETLSPTDTMNLLGAVPETRTINNKSLNNDIILYLNDLEDVDTTGAFTNSIIKYTGLNWEVSDINGILPSQTGNQDKFLTTDGTSAYWAKIDALPSQTGNQDKFLTTDGTSAYWATVDALPSQAGNENKFLTTDGSGAYWKDFGTINGYSLSASNITLTYASVGAEKSIYKNAFPPPNPNHGDLWVDLDDANYLLEHNLTSHPDYNDFLNNLPKTSPVLKKSFTPKDANLINAIDEPSLVWSSNPSGVKWSELIFSKNSNQTVIWELGPDQTSLYDNTKGINIDIYCYSESSSGGDVVWEINMIAVTDSMSINTAFNPVYSESFTLSFNGYSPEDVNYINYSYTPNNLLSDCIWYISLRRLSDDPTDTLNGNVKLLNFTIYQVIPE